MTDQAMSPLRRRRRSAQKSDAPHALRILRTGGERPTGRATEQRDEIAPSQ
jgi:hypothetical protein